MSDTHQRVAVVGLGKLGLCLAGCLAERGFETLGVDSERRVVDLVNQGRTPWFEPGLAELLARNAGRRLRATTAHAEAIENSDVTIVLVATPSNPDGSFSNRFIEAGLRSLSEAFGRSSKPYHSFVISSTVMPGSTAESFIPIIEAHSGRKLHQHFSVCYDPDFVALGNAINGFLEPDLVIIGESDPEAGARMRDLHQRLCTNQPVISCMSVISAELAKVCLNAYITTKITFANSVANLCERIPGADVDTITRAIGADRRISPYYFRGGLSFGGTCFPRDTHAYMVLAQKYGVQAKLIEATNTVNNLQDQHLAEIVLRELDRVPQKTVGVLGLAFTPKTPVITESPAIKLIRELLRHDVRVIVSDPLAIENTRAQLGSTVEYLDSPTCCLKECNLAVITLRDDEIKQAVEAFQPEAPLTVIDAWRILDPAKLDARMIRYVTLGRFTPPDEPAKDAQCGPDDLIRRAARSASF
jgi:UDPglucose 6-dehydrogenase